MKQIPQDVSESTKRRNPHLYPPLGSLPVDSDIVKLLIKNNYTPKPPKRIRQSSKPRLNKLELEYQNMLATLYYDADCISSQAIRFNLANGLWYKPDFVVFKDALLAIEVKGPHAFRGGFENLKMAARLYPFITWRLAWKQDGEWKEQTVLP